MVINGAHRINKSDVVHFWRTKVTGGGGGYYRYFFFRHREADEVKTSVVLVHHEIGEEHCGLTFTVNFGVAPRSFDTLSGACEYIDGSVDELERLGLQQHALT